MKRVRDGRLFCNFTPAISSIALKSLRSKIGDLDFQRQTQLSLTDISRRLNPLLRGWVAYYGRFTPSALEPLFRYVDLTLKSWVQRKYKRFRTHKRQTSRYLNELA